MRSDEVGMLNSYLSRRGVSSPDRNQAGYSNGMAIDYVALGAMLRDARERKGLTQEQVGRRLNCTGAAISLIEKGRVRAPVERVERFADVVGCSLSVYFAAPGDARAELLVRLAAHLPELEPPLVEALQAWVDLWDKKRALPVRA